MNDLHKYLIGTAAGIVLCLLIWGGYSLIFGGKGTNNVPISTNELNGGAIGTASGQSSDILGNNGFFAAENDSNELTQEQQERLLAAQAANESLAKKYGTQDGSNLQNQQSLLDSQTDGTGSAYPGVFGYDALALNRGTQEQETARAIGNQKLEEDRNKVRGYIVQGKSAAQKNQLDNALTAFEHADEAMPDDKDFEAASYHDMASSLFLLSKTTSDTQTAQKARDEAERYIKKSLAARNNTDARELYSNIIAEYQKAAEAKRQQALLAQQQAAERARKEDQAEQQRRQVVELIGQGKNAVNKRQLNSAASAFDRAAASMPDNKQFASDSYTEMADAMLNLAQHLSNPNDVQTSLNKAENYIKAALAAQNSSGARNLYAKILDARKEQERLAQAKAEAQRKQQEQSAQAAAQKKAEEQRKEQERLAQARAEAQRKQQEQAAQAAAQKKAEEQRKQQERLAQAKAEAQRKQQEQAAQAAAQKKAEEQRKEQERLAQAKAEAQRKQQEQAAQAEAQRKQQEQPKTAAHKQVENLIAQGITAAQRKQLNNAILALDRASRFMPKDDDFAEESYRKMADAMFNLAENSTDKQTKSGALKKADEYIKKGLASKNTSESQALAAKIAGAQSALQAQANSAAKPQTAQQTHQAAPQKNTDANKANQANTANNANAQAAAQARAAAQAEAAQKAQAELLAKKHEVDALVQQGKKSAASGNFAAAQSAFSKAAAQIPSGDAAFAAEQYREMADAMQSLAKTSPAHKDQALKDAADYIKKSIASKNDDAKAHYVYAQIADAQNNGSLAVQELEAARRLDPQNAQYNYELGRKYFAQKKYPQARTAFEQAVKSNPQFEAAFFNLGMTHKIMNANDAALTAFSKAAALKPDYVRAWIEMARMQDKKRNYGEAINNYRKALSLEPSNTSALKEMAQVYSKQKDAQQAERYFKEALTLGDADPVTYYNLAAVQLELGKTAEALQNAQKALAVNDKDARFLYTYGLALEKNNRLREAEDYYTRAVTADGNYSKPRINLGRIQLEAGHLDSAEQHLLAAYRAEPSNFEVNMNLGKLYGLKNQYGKAIDYYTNAIKIMPKDIDARQNLAAVYLSAGLKENARDTYRDIIKINPQAWDSYYELGKVYISLDNKAEAKAIFEQLLKQKPNYRYAAEVRKLLVNL
ncbi:MULTISPECIES: tetratricopeptide repeat protein [unclassified Treponema]|uniref:tetratricopeptide repeat protein n=1 Tax=unclassified Treponema TaxID=2638727 RepID=UPI0005300D46|nr:MULTISPECIES: tetratricopeptide repeat protein [unclassified Treponema]AIW89213.1 TPR domain protein [Treponema sp. OMZ 838]UTC50743.1 tetratricopeptide repeat protein [Treponema sp. OMZ 855]